MSSIRLSGWIEQARIQLGSVISSSGPLASRRRAREAFERFAASLASHFRDFLPSDLRYFLRDHYPLIIILILTYIMVLGLPSSPVGWGLIIISLRMIRIDDEELNRCWREPRVKRQSQESPLTPIVCRLLFSFLLLFLAFETTTAGIAGVTFGALYLSPRLNIPNYGRTKAGRRRRTVMPSTSDGSRTAMVQAKDTRRWSAELRKLLETEEELGPRRGEVTSQQVETQAQQKDASDVLMNQASFDPVSQNAIGLGIAPDMQKNTTRLVEKVTRKILRDTQHQYSRPQSRLSNRDSEEVSPVETVFTDMQEASDDTPPSSPIDAPQLDGEESDGSHDSIYMIEVEVGDVVELIDGREGIVKFLGSRISSVTEWIGIDFLQPTELGMLTGASYADWSSEDGLFVRPSAVRRILHRPPPPPPTRSSTRMSAGTVRTLTSIVEHPRENDSDFGAETDSEYPTGSQTEESDEEIDAARLSSTRMSAPSMLAVRGSMEDEAARYGRGWGREYEDGSGDEYDDEDVASESDTYLDRDSQAMCSTILDQAIQLEHGLFSRRDSTLGSDNGVEDMGPVAQCSLCVGDTDVFESRLGVLADQLEDIMTSPCEDTETEQAQADDKAWWSSAAEAPLVPVFGDVQAPGRKGPNKSLNSLKQRWQRWSKGRQAGQNVNAKSISSEVVHAYVGSD